MKEELVPPATICPVLVGRARDLAHLRGLAERARQGQGQIALVAGEAGIGKTRLLAELKGNIQDFHLLLEGQCFQTESAISYAPLFDLFRAFLASSPASQAPDAVQPFAATIAQVLPELALPHLNSATISPLAPEEAQRWLFSAMTNFILDHASQQPICLMAEDLHWCDDNSLALLLHLARRCRRVPCLLLFTYRHDEAPSKLKRWLAHLERERLAQEWVIARFARGEVAVMLQAMLHLNEGVVDGELLEALYGRSEGNPFFVEELFKVLVTTDQLALVNGTWKSLAHQAAVPRSVQEAVRQRMAYVSADAQRLLLLAAVVGRRFNVILLREVMACDEAHLLLLLKEVMAAQLVVEEAADQFAFRHALTQQAILNGLLIRERRELHRTLAQTLQRLADGAPVREAYLEELAYHTYEAALWEPALTAAQAMGEKNLKLYAHQAAITQFSHAVEAAMHLGRVPSAHLFLARGQACEMLGDFERARGDYARALAAAQSARQHDLEWQSLMALGFLWTGHDYARAGEWFQQALTLAEQLDDATLRARSLNRLGNWLVNIGRIPEGQAAHQAALALFETRGDRHGMAETFELLGMAAYFMGDPATAVLEYFGRTIDLFRALDDPQGLFSALAARCIDSAPETIESTFSALRTRDTCLRDAEEALQLARQTQNQSGQAFVEMVTTQVLASFGTFGSALAHAQEALRIATAIDHQEWIAATTGALGHLHLLLLDPINALGHLQTAVAAAQTLGSAIWTRQLTPYLALAQLQLREFARATATLATVLPSDQSPENFFERQAARIWGELALAQGDATRALAIAHSLLATVPGQPRPQPIPHLFALQGEALLAAQRLEEAAEAFALARLGAEQRQAPSLLWRILRSQGLVCRLLKQEAQAQQAWAAAHQILATLGATIEANPIRERFLQAALATFPPTNPHSPLASTKSALDGLSSRESEVALLIAQGKTNREIATALVVSERTAEVHVSHILSKLGFATRAQIAAWVVTKRLA